MIRTILPRSVVALCLVAVSTGALHAAEKAMDKGRAAAGQSVSFNVYLPLQNRAALESQIAKIHDSSSPQYHHWMTPAEFTAKFAPTAAQVAAVQKQLAAQGLTATAVGPQRLQVSGPASAVESALQTQLHAGSFANGRKTVMAASQPVVSGALAQQGAVISGLSGFVRMRAFAHKAASVIPSNRYSPTGAYWFTDLKQAYNWPSYKTYTGKGTTIGILMAGDFNPADMTQYFSHEKLATPKFSTVQINGGAPYDPDGSFETHLDLQQSGGMAPNANVILYNVPDLADDNILAGLAKIVNDNQADVVSMSFGGPEAFYTAAYNGGTDYTYLLQEENDLMAQGVAQGITFVASSGDAGALTSFPVACFDGIPDCGAALPSAMFPASSPNVVGVGGTNLVTTYTSSTDLNSAYVRESAFADPLVGDIFYGTSSTGQYWGSGGGDSVLFKKPLFQALTNTGNARFRTVPDVSLHMGGCPGGAISCGADDSADVAVIGGQAVGVIGTSASAPDFAGLTALAVQRFGTRMGNENYYIYALALSHQIGLTRNVFHQGIPGFNGLYYTTPKGYNRVLGNGTVSARDFLLAPFVPAAGKPQTPSNP
ncbi:putative protease [Terriglobus roseus DSM 18391]|uniref:Putative protease n=1 Tax=Terriglobus roseus (strain DSM 18391 / NRRL B-41598 / KBS 63) TaxID=926566 RepID=I3ZL51_TERRK|nr:S53 family serine peptidase [Terriglobus roseus]AFL89969.1 putative protease [Terriglobus roseus DSM 18391]